MTQPLQRTRVSIELSVAAERAYQSFCSVERIPEWIPYVRVLEIVRRYPSGFAEEVRFESTLENVVRQYVLVYVYDLPRFRVAWETPSTETFLFRGDAELVPMADRRSVLEYYIYERPDETAMHGAGAPARRVAYSKQMVKAFKQWLEASVSA